MSFLLNAAIPVLLCFAVLYALCDWTVRRVERSRDDDFPPAEGG